MASKAAKTTKAVTKEDIIANELMREILEIRTETLWNMLGMKAEGKIPKVGDEGATSEFDNKGALILPGKFVYADKEGMPIVYEQKAKMSAKEFRQAVRRGMENDNAILLYPDGIASCINLDNGSFFKAAKRVLGGSRGARRKKKKFGGHVPKRITEKMITTSYCPPYVPDNYGARTLVSADIATCMVNPSLYFEYCEEEFKLRDEERKTFCGDLDTAQDPILGRSDAKLAPPYLVVCQQRRYREPILTGITKILGVGGFGEFAALTFEEESSDLLKELAQFDETRKEINPDEIFAEYADTRAVLVLRFYPQSKEVGTRAPRDNAVLITPLEAGIDKQKAEKACREKYNLS